MSEERLNDELAAVEAALRSLTPAASAVSRDRLMFLAGRASVKAASPHRPRQVRAWLWPCATAVSLLLAAVFGVLWAAGGRPQVAQQAIYAHFPPTASPITADVPSAAESPPSLWANRRLCQFVLEKGVDALPEPSVAPASKKPATQQPENSRQLLNQVLNGSPI
jgi:hypothetical protein